MLELSISIPTRNRPGDVKTLLFSILNQTAPPKEVVIVDDSDNQQTEALTQFMQARFQDKGIQLRYIRGGGESVTQARNIGIDRSTGEILCSIDDDVIMAKDYTEKILKVFEGHPEALGAAGHVKNLFLRGSSNGINKVLEFFSTEKDKCRVFPTGFSYPVPLTRMINCEWLSGTNCSYRRKVLEKFRWDEKLKKYALCDDLDISYRIQKWQPKSLFMTPEAKIIHTQSQLARIESEKRVNMEISYHAYFFFKNMRQTQANLFRFYYGIFLGRIMISVLSGKPQSVVYTLKAQIHLIKNLGKIKRGLID